MHPIETESYAILRTRLDTADLPPLTRAVVERIVHTTADPTWAGDLVCAEDALRAGRDALLAGAPLITDVRMVAVGITARAATVALDLAPDPVDGLTRSAAGIRAAAQAYPEGAVWVIGNAPTALAELLGTGVRSPLVIGLPVGFVGSVAAKAALRQAGWAAVSNRSERGGAAAAAAAVNALLYTEGSLAGPSMDAEGSLAGPSRDAEGSLAGPSRDADGSLAGPSTNAEETS
ncbi:MAG: precorrin-8X methylmutase [Pseudonocardia sp.]|nr:precorrin-8X methylmutase [Pseudonocardia sp.]